MTCAATGGQNDGRRPARLNKKEKSSPSRGRALWRIEAVGSYIGGDGV